MHQSSTIYDIKTRIFTCRNNWCVGLFDLNGRITVNKNRHTDFSHVQFLTIHRVIKFKRTGVCIHRDVSIIIHIVIIKKSLITFPTVTNTRYTRRLTSSGSCSHSRWFTQGSAAVCTQLVYMEVGYREPFIIYRAVCCVSYSQTPSIPFRETYRHGSDADNTTTWLFIIWIHPMLHRSACTYSSNANMCRYS